MKLLFFTKNRWIKRHGRKFYDRVFYNHSVFSSDFKIQYYSSFFINLDNKYVSKKWKILYAFNLISIRLILNE